MDIAAINRQRGLAVMDDGAIIPIEVWLDDEGDECGPDEAVVAVAGPDAAGWWHPVVLSNFEQATFH